MMMFTVICSDKLGAITIHSYVTIRRHTHFALCNSEELIRRTIFLEFFLLRLLHATFNNHYGIVFFYRFFTHSFA